MDCVTVTKKRGEMSPKKKRHYGRLWTISSARASFRLLGFVNLFTCRKLQASLRLPSRFGTLKILLVTVKGLKGLRTPS